MQFRKIYSSPFTHSLIAFRLSHGQTDHIDVMASDSIMTQLLCISDASAANLTTANCVSRHAYCTSPSAVIHNALASLCAKRLLCSCMDYCSVKRQKTIALHTGISMRIYWVFGYGCYCGRFGENDRVCCGRQNRIHIHVCGFALVCQSTLFDF